MPVKGFVSLSYEANKPGEKMSAPLCFLHLTTTKKGIADSAKTNKFQARLVYSSRKIFGFFYVSLCTLIRGFS